MHISTSIRNDLFYTNSTFTVVNNELRYRILNKWQCYIYYLVVNY